MRYSLFHNRLRCPPMPDHTHREVKATFHDPFENEARHGPRLPNVRHLAVPNAL